MKRKYNFWLIFGITYIALWVGASMAMIGDHFPAGIIGWELPLEILLLLVPVYIFGIFTALEERKEI